MRWVVDLLACLNRVVLWLLFCGYCWVIFKAVPYEERLLAVAAVRYFFGVVPYFFLKAAI